MAADRTEDIVRTWSAAWSTADAAEELADLFTDDCVYEDVSAGVHLQGKEQLRQFYELSRAAFPDFALTLSASVTAEDRASVEWTMHATHQGELLGIAPTGQAVTLRGISFLELRGDKVARCADYYDSAALFRQIGATPPH
jgi:steroid delta-isomerase-like uncharacterized protein